MMMSLSWQRIWELLSGGPDASVSEIVLRVALISCTVVALIQLLTMWGTRWGDRNSLTKSLGLSVLIHMCLGLGWATVVESYPTLPPEPVYAESPIQIRDVLTSFSDADEEPQLPSSSEVLGGQPAFRSLMKEGIRTRQERPKQAPELPSPTDVPAPRIATSRELPSFSTVDEQPAVPNAVSTETLATRVAAPTPAAERAAPEARAESGPPRFSREPIGRAATSLLPMEANRERPATIPPSRPEITSLSPLPSTALPLEPTQSNRGPVPVPRAPGSLPVGRGAPAPRAVLRGIVRDAKTGQPVAGTTVRVDLADRQPILTRTDEDGVYALALSQMPDNVAVSASRPGYLPESKNLRVNQRDEQDRRLDFTLRGKNESVVAIENNPAVHHLGNDRFEGPANSQFQRVSEGESFTARFEISAEQRAENPGEVSVTFLAKGMQCPPQVRLNDRLLTKGLTVSPTDGSFGKVVLPIDPAWLQAGDNFIRIRAVNCNGGDLDDFEFVNLQVRLSP